MIVWLVGILREIIVWTVEMVVLYVLVNAFLIVVKRYWPWFLAAYFEEKTRYLKNLAETGAEVSSSTSKAKQVQ